MAAGSHEAGEGSDELLLGHVTRAALPLICCDKQRGGGEERIQNNSPKRFFPTTTALVVLVEAVVVNRAETPLRYGLSGVVSPVSWWYSQETTVSDVQAPQLTVLGGLLHQVKPLRGPGLRAGAISA
ncbi:unnamed protein product [Boreogadus saida]